MQSQNTVQDKLIDMTDTNTSNVTQADRLAALDQYKVGHTNRPTATTVSAF